MTEQLHSKEKLKELVGMDPGYDLEAYVFVREALDYLFQEMKERRHINARELLEGIRRYALEEYGPLARIVLEHWGVYRCEDFGRIVFRMVDRGIMKKTERDSIDDFKGGYDFSRAFDRPFLFPPERKK